MKGLEQYDVKVLLALVKSVSGRIDFFKVLIESGYPELAAFSNAIRGDDDAMVWLFKNNYAWLAILSNDVDSLKWLYQRKLGVLLMLVREVEKFLKYQEKEYTWPYVMHFGGHYRAMMELKEWKNATDRERTNQKEKQIEHDKERQQQNTEEL